jgi:hypothetical protein
MKSNSARRYEILAEDRRTSRRTMADAIAVLQDYAGFAETDHAEIRIRCLNLPSAEVVGLVQIVFDCPVNDKAYVVSLPTSKQFRARRPNTSEYERLDIAQLHEATLDGTGNVRLTDGATLRAVEVLPARLPLAPSTLDWLILYHTIRFVGAEEQSSQSLRDAFNDPPIDMIPNLFWIDCGKLTGLAIPKLDSITAYITSIERTLVVSQQKIADTLRKFGVRFPQPRPRAKARHA